MIGFIGFGQSPELGKKVKTFSALAPVATVGHIEGAMKVLSYFTGEIVVSVSISLLSNRLIILHFMVNQIVLLCHPTFLL